MKKGQQADTLKKKTYQGLIIAENFSDSRNYSLVSAPVESSLEKAIQLLEKSKVEEIFVFASASKDEVVAFLNNRPQKKISVKFIYSPECSSFGDCIRAVHAMKVINQPFVLMLADVFTEISLLPIIENYEQKLEKMKPLLMLKLFFEKEANVPKEFDEKNLIVYDKSKMLLKQYQKLPENPISLIEIKENSKFNFKGIFDEPANAEKLFINTSLVDAGISVCSVEYLSYFSENFDFHNERDDFLKDLLSSEINDDNVALHILDHGIFHKRVVNPFELYRATSLIIKNCFNKFYINKDDYLFSRFNRIISKKSNIGINSHIGNHTFIGENVQIGEDAVIENSIILSNTKIGNNTKISNCFIGANSVIESECVLKHVYSPFVLNVSERKKAIESSTFNGDTWSTFSHVDPEAVVEDDEEPHFEFNDNMSYVEADFQDEIKETINKLSEDMSNIESGITELINIRLAENRPHIEMVETIFEQILICNKFDKDNVVTSIKKLSGWAPLLKKFVIGDEEMQKIIEICENFTDENSFVKFHLLVQMLYQIEVLTEGPIIEWFESKQTSANPKDTQRIALMEKFVEWLKNAEHDEDDEEEEEEEEEETD